MEGGFLPAEPPPPRGGDGPPAGPSGRGGGGGGGGGGPFPNLSAFPGRAGAGTAAAAALATACARCPSPLSTTDAEWAAAFGLALCPACKAADHLVSRKTAKELYLVTDADLSRLGRLSRANPHGALYAPMQLFLESQVAAAAASRHGADTAGAADPASVAAALEPARAARLEARLAGRSRKRGAAERTAAEAEARLARARARIDAHAAEVEVKKEEEVEVKDEEASSDDDSDVVEVGEDGRPVERKPEPPVRRTTRLGGRGGGGAKVAREII